MDNFIKICAAVLIAAILCVVLNKRDKDISLLLTVAVSAMVLVCALTQLQDVIALIRRLQELSGMDEAVFEVLLKSVGIGLLGELVSVICTDIGNAALGKAINILSTAVILWLSIPMITSLLDLIQELIGKV